MFSFRFTLAPGTGPPKANIVHFTSTHLFLPLHNTALFSSRLFLLLFFSLKAFRVVEKIFRDLLDFFQDILFWFKTGPNVLLKIEPALMIKMGLISCWTEVFWVKTYKSHFLTNKILPQFFNHFKARFQNMRARFDSYNFVPCGAFFVKKSTKLFTVWEGHDLSVQLRNKGGGMGVTERPSFEVPQTCTTRPRV